MSAPSDGSFPPQIDGFEIRRHFRGLDYVHFVDESYVYASGRNHVFRKPHGGSDFSLLASLPVRRAADRVLLRTRLTRRVFRKRVENVVALPTGTVIAVADGQIFRVADGRRPELVFDLVRCRGTMHRGVAITPTGELFLGEYLRNERRGPVRIVIGTADGAQWDECYRSPAGKFCYYHGCFWDPFERCLWFTTGDDPHENFLARTDVDFHNVEYIGDGSKTFSAVNLIFRRDHVYFGNTNHMGANYICRLHRKSGHVERLAKANGPVWYAYETSDRWMMFASNVEPCPTLRDTNVHVYASQDGETWRDVRQWSKDRWVPWVVFQFGVVNFPAGTAMNSDNVWLSGQALRGWSLGIARGALTLARAVGSDGVRATDPLGQATST